MQDARCPGCGDPARRHGEDRRVNVYLGGCGFNNFPSLSVLVDLYFRGYCIHTIHVISGSIFPAIWFYKNLACGALGGDKTPSDLERMCLDSLSRFPSMTLLSVNFGFVRSFLLDDVLGLTDRPCEEQDAAVHLYFHGRLHIYRRNTLALMACHVTSDFPTLDGFLALVIESISIPGLTHRIPTSRFMDAGVFPRSICDDCGNPYPRIVLEALPASARDALATISCGYVSPRLSVSQSIPNQYLGFAANKRTRCYILSGTLVYV